MTTRLQIIAALVLISTIMFQTTTSSMIPATSGGPLIIPYPLKIPFVGDYGTYSEGRDGGGSGHGYGHNYVVGHGGPLIIPQPVYWGSQHY